MSYNVEWSTAIFTPKQSPSARLTKIARMIAGREARHPDVAVKIYDHSATRKIATLMNSILPRAGRRKLVFSQGLRQRHCQSSISIAHDARTHD